MSFEPTLDPELRVLLQEIAANPRAKLFRERIPRPSRLPLTEIPWVRPTATGLTSAESHLLRVHREEVARILRQASAVRLLRSPIVSVRVTPFVSAVRARQLPTERELCRRVIAARARAGGLPLEPLVEELLLSATHGVSSGGTEAHQLAALSLRFTPDDAAWGLIARCMLLEGARSAGRSVLGQIVRRRQGVRNLRSALSGLGVSYSAARDHQTASVFYRLASSLPEPTPNSLLSWLTEAVLSADLRRAGEAAGMVEAHLDSDAPALEDWLRRLSQRKAQGLFSVDEAALRVALRLLENGAPVVGRVLHDLSL